MKIVNLRQTCDSCPSQWEGRLLHAGVDHDLYVRYRWGVLRAAVDGVTVGSVEIGDSMDGFISWVQAEPHIHGWLVTWAENQNADTEHAEAMRRRFEEL